jgi:hemerythrin-like domain-containing protein
MKTPTDVLREEHVVILRLLEALEAAAARPVPEGWWEQAVALVRGFADGSHHAREEQHLFPAMVRCGVPSPGGPVDVMLMEHEEGRRLVARIAAGDPGTRAGAVRDYVRLLRAHIDKENGILFPMADAVLDERDVRTLAEAFEAAQAEMGPAASMKEAEAAVERLLAALPR